MSQDRKFVQERIAESVIEGISRTFKAVTALTFTASQVVETLGCVRRTAIECSRSSGDHIRGGGEATKGGGAKGTWRLMNGNVAVPAVMPVSFVTDLPQQRLDRWHSATKHALKVTARYLAEDRISLL